MDDNPHDNQRLKIQSAAFILLVGGMLIGLGGVLVDLFPRFPLPPQLDLSLEGGIAVLLIGAGYSAVILSCSTARVVLAIAMALFGVHGIDHHLSPDVAIGHDPLPLVSAILLVLFTYQLMMGLSLARIRANQARALEVKEQRFRSLFTQNPDVVLCIEPDGTVRDVNPATQSVLANRPEGLVGRHYREALPGCASEGEGSREVTAAFECARGGRSQSFDLRFDEGGKTRVFEANFMPNLVQGQVEGVFGMFKDVSEHVTAQETRLAYQAAHDVLTGLPNRALFNDRLAHDLELARRSGRSLGCCSSTWTSSSRSTTPAARQ